MTKTTPSDFVTAFNEAGGPHALAYSGLIRFVAIMLVILSVLWAIAHFMGMEAKASEFFMEALGSRLVRLFFGLTLFISLLMTRGS
jgi:hypothetical protein